MNYFSFKELLRTVTCLKDNTINFMKKNNILHSHIIYLGPCVVQRRSNNCGKSMELKSTNDNHDKYMWRCRKVNTVVKGDQKYKCKDVKLSIRHNSWLVDTKLMLEIVLELMYLWAQAFSINEIIHKLKLRKETVMEWSIFFTECCTSTIMDASQAIGGNGVEVEIDESKFGKRKYH